MTSRSERFHELMASLEGDWLDQPIDEKLKDPDYRPREVEWRDDPDPLGMDWEWLYPPREGPPTARGSESGKTSQGKARGSDRRRTELRAPDPPSIRLFRPVITAAAAVLLLSLGVLTATRFFVSDGPIREQTIAAWTTPGPSQRSTAPGAPPGVTPGTSSYINEVDPAARDTASSTPAVHAPLDAQDDLVVPEISPETVLDPDTPAPIRSVSAAIPPGDLFYLTFSTLNTPSEGSAVVVRVGPEAWGLLRDELRVRPDVAKSYFGPLKMGDAPTDYLVITADLARAPLLQTVAEALPEGEDRPAIETWKTRLRDALEDAGHDWYGVQRIHVEPERFESPPAN